MFGPLEMLRLKVERKNKEFINNIMAAFWR
jgi:hypothetical protein